MIDRYQAAFLAEEYRTSVGIDNHSSIDVFEVARKIPHLTIVLYPLGENISGMCVMGEKFSVIAVNSKQTRGRQRFTLAHELYHLRYDKEKRTSICPTDISEYDDTERMADAFASYLLLPYHALRKEYSERGLSSENHSYSEGDLITAALEIEYKYGVSRKALTSRLFEDGIITRGEKERLCQNVKIGARQYGFSTALYEPCVGDGARRVEGEYIDLIAELLSVDILSEGRAKELLADGFRQDIEIVSLGDGEIVD